MTLEQPSHSARAQEPTADFGEVFAPTASQRGERRILTADASGKTVGQIPTGVECKAGQGMSIDSMNSMQIDQALAKYKPNSCIADSTGQMRQHPNQQGELLPDSDKRVYSPDDALTRLTKNDTVNLQDVWKEKNRIFAAAGRPFGTDAARAEFENDGYKPNVHYNDAHVKPEERANINTLFSLENLMTSAAGGQAIEQAKAAATAAGDPNSWRSRIQFRAEDLHKALALKPISQ